MKKILVKSSAVLLTILLLTQSTVSFASSAEGKISFNDSWLNFEPWTGSGTISVSIGDDFLTKDRDIVSFDEFEELRYKYSDEALDYTVAESNGNTVITIKEDYLKTLADGTYYLEAEFSRAIIPVKLYIVTRKIELKDLYYSFDEWSGSGSAQVKISSDDEDSFTLESALFKSLSYKGVEIAASNYSIKQYMNVIYITLKEEYVKTLPTGINYFKIDFLNVGFMLKLEIKSQTEPNSNNQPDNKNKQSKPSAAKVKKVSAKKISKKNQSKVTWKKVTGASGYQVKWAANKKFKKAKKKFTKKNSITLKKLTKKKYYVKVRAYKVVNGEKVYGVFSKVKVIKK